MRYLLLLLLLGSLVLLGAFFLSSEQETPVPSLTPGTGSNPGVSEAAGPGEAPGAVGLLPIEPTQAERLSGAVAPLDAEAPASPEAPLNHPWQAELAGVRGRLVEADGNAVAGMTVTLLAAGNATLEDGSMLSLPVVELEVGEAVTDAEGRFEIRGAVPANHHVLGLDLGGPRAGLRLIDRSLAFGQITDLGDVVLDPFGTVTGLVVDEDGEPVEGALVRMGSMPGLTASIALALREDSLFGVPEGNTLQPRPLPAWAVAALERYPASTTRTGPDGTFRLEGVPAGRIVGNVVFPGLVDAAIPRFKIAARGEHDLGELELLPGRTATGRVLDAAGQPVVGAEVIAGTVPLFPKFAILQRCAPTDAEGRFEATGISNAGNVVLAARRHDGEAWTSNVAARALKGVMLTLPSRATFTIDVVDAATGQALEDATVELRPAYLPSRMGLQSYRNLLGPDPAAVPANSASEIKPGRYTAPQLPVGRWAVTVNAPGYGSAEMECEHAEVPEPHAAELQAGDVVRFTVVDDASREPVTAAHVALVGLVGDRPRPVEAGWSDADGSVKLISIASTGEATDGRVVVEHPDYGRAGFVFDPQGNDDGEATLLRLARAASIRGTVTWDGEIPDERYALSLAQTDRGFGLPLKFSSTDDAGNFEFAGVAEGTYTLELLEQLPADDALGFLKSIVMKRRFSVKPVGYSQEVVVSGEDVALSIDLGRDGSPRKGWIEGSLRIDGQPVVGARVQIAGGGKERFTTDETGRFRSPELDPISTGLDFYLLRKENDEDAKGQWNKVHDSEVIIRSGQATQVDVAYSEILVDIEVRDQATQEPVEEAAVFLTYDGLQTTDAKGKARLRVRVYESPEGGGNGQFAQFTKRVRVAKLGYILKEVAVSDLEAGGKLPTVVELRAAIPFSGRVILPEGLSVEDPGSEVTPWFSVRAPSSPEGTARGIDIDLETLTFSGQLSWQLSGHGLYYATYEFGQGQVSTVPVEVPEGGATDLVIDFSER